MSPDSVYIGGSNHVLDGLGVMLEAALSDHDLVRGWMGVPTLLYVLEIAKRAEDRPEWFPHGKWATIQSLQVKVEKALDGIWGGST